MLSHVRQGKETVVLGRADIDDLTTGHQVGVDIDRIDRVGNEYDVIGRKQVENVAQIALCTVRDKDFVSLKLDVTIPVILLYRLFEEVITLLGAVAVQRVLTALIVHGIVQRADDRGCVGTGHVTDAQTDDVSLGVCLLERRYLVCDGGKQIALGQVFIVSVNLHGFDFSSQRLR